MSSVSIWELFRLDGKVALVTGSSQGLGYDMATALAEAGADVAITSRTLSKAEKVAHEIKTNLQVDTIAIEMEQSNWDSVNKMAQDVLAWKGHIDILINNAGGWVMGETNLFKRLPENIEKLVDKNLIGLIYCCKAVGGIMMEQGYGKIINIGSIAGLVGRDRRIYSRHNKAEQPIDYASTKAGVAGLTRDLAGLMSPHGICVNNISPGGFNRGNIPEGFDRDYSDKTPFGRMGRMGSDIKGAALFLASPASDYVTGHDLIVDGGFNIWK